MSATDRDLLRQFCQHQSQDAFTALVQRHVNLVYSAALRQVRSPQLAEEVAQAVFADLAGHAGKLKPDTILTAWLYQVARRTAIDVVRREARRQLREQIAMEMNTLQTPEAGWTQIEPLLDEAVSALDETDRTAILLRYFDNKSLREVGEQLGVSDDAAQKRVSRAVEQLRAFFAKRKVIIGASGLMLLISANAVHAAPGWLAATISTGVVISAVHQGTTIGLTKIAIMTTMQKTVIAATLAVALGIGVFEAHTVSQLRGQVQAVQQQAAPLAGQVRDLQMERDNAQNELAGLRNENARLHSNQTELLQLRAEVTRLRTAAGQVRTGQPSPGLDLNDSDLQHFLMWKASKDKMVQYLAQMPDKRIPELCDLTEQDWWKAAQNAKFDNDENIRRSFSELRQAAKSRLPMGSALHDYLASNNNQLPTDMSQLKPYLESAMADSAPDEGTIEAILGRYKLLHTGNFGDYPVGTYFIAEKAPVDTDYDSRAEFGDGRSSTTSTGVGQGGTPDYGSD